MTIKEMIDNQMKELAQDPLCHIPIIPYYYTTNDEDKNQGYSDNVKKLEKQIYKSKLDDDFKDVIDVGHIALTIALNQVIHEVRAKMIETGERATMCYYNGGSFDNPVKFDYLEALQLLYNLISGEYEVKHIKEKYENN